MSQHTPAPPAPPAPRARMLTLQQASTETGIPYTSLRDMVQRGHLAGLRVGDARRIRVLRQDLDKLIANAKSEADKRLIKNAAAAA